MTHLRHFSDQRHFYIVLKAFAGSVSALQELCIIIVVDVQSRYCNRCVNNIF